MTLKIRVNPCPNLSSIANTAAHGSVEDPDNLEVLGSRNKHTSKYHKEQTSSARPTHTWQMSLLQVQLETSQNILKTMKTMTTRKLL